MNGTSKMNTLFLHYINWNQSKMSPKIESCGNYSEINVKCKFVFEWFFSQFLLLAHGLSFYVNLKDYKRTCITWSVNQREHQQSVEEESIYSSLLDIIQYGAKIAHDEGNINQVHIQKQERFFTSGVKIVRFFFIFSFIFFPCVNFKRYDLNFFYSWTLNMFKNICYITFLAFEQEVALALKLNCRQGVFIFRNIEGNMFDIN